ncbi:hypothetical protein RF11_09379 [Thelohanellus kitauei]|uniref:Uncharacterized protein n=1 Tax=Thelohanellus kitauei TaxID=669202 RepID=A0A0C2IYX9_THEKT|nr:hypothetical protein RF11_09379 [Thelohanellus kitauei]
MSDYSVNKSTKLEKPKEETLETTSETRTESNCPSITSTDQEIQKNAEDFLVKNYKVSRTIGPIIMLYEDRILYQLKYQPYHWAIWKELTQAWVYEPLLMNLKIKIFTAILTSIKQLVRYFYA